MAEKSGPQIDNYRLIQRLGEGSFGEVFLAEHVTRKIQYAIKILRARLSQDTLGDFLNEARAFRLEHPNIMRIRDFGVDNEIPFLVMDYVPGGTLRRKHPFGSHLSLPTIISYVKQIGEALQYAHDDGLVHRDVKPENMLVGPKGEILLSDFGIVTTSYTWNPAGAHGVAGTAVYMAPEQIDGKPVRASDQYALATIVYEWLIGHPPFRGNVAELAVQHLTKSPPSLHEGLPSLPSSVEAVIMRALAKDPRQRFPSVREFAEALEQANRPPVGTTLQIFTGHSDWVIATAWSPDGSRIASASNDKTVQVWDSTSAQVLCSYYDHAREISAVTWSPDGSRIASASNDKTVQVWEAATGKRLYTYNNHCDEVWTVSWSPDNKYIASASCDRTLQVWEATSGKILHTYQGHTDYISVIAWSPDNKHIASASYDKTVQVREVTTGNVMYTSRNHSGGVFALAWSPDGKYLASASYDQTVQIHEVNTGMLLLTYLGHTEGVFAVAWSPDGDLVASGGDDKLVQVWQYATGHILTTYRSHTQGVRTISWSPDGQTIASGGVDSAIHIWQAT